MKLTKEQLEVFQPLANHVLLKQHSDNTMIKFNNSFLKLDTSYKPEFHIDRVFTVVKPPKRIAIEKSEYSMQWQTKMMLREGDRVWVNYLHSIKPAFRFTCDGEKYILIHYQYIYLALRRWNPEDHGLHILIPSQLTQNIIKISRLGDCVFHPPAVNFEIRLIDDNDNETPWPQNIIQDSSHITNSSVMSFETGYHLKATYLYEVVMLNGYILFEGEHKRQRRDLVYVRTPKFRIGKVVFAGRPNDYYNEKSYWDDNYLTVGQEIHLKFGEYVTLEDPVHRLFPWPDELFVTQRRYVVGVINKKSIGINLVEE